VRDRNPDASAPPPQASGCPRQAGLYDCIWDAGSDDHAMSCGCHSEAVKNRCSSSSSIMLPGVSLRHSVAAVFAGMSGCTTWAIWVRAAVHGRYSTDYLIGA